MRSKSYLDKNHCNWSSIFQKNLIIPLNHRHYDCNPKNIEELVLNIIDTFEDTFTEDMDTISVIDINNNTELWDGQKRAVSIMLFLKCISNLILYKDPSKAIISKITYRINDPGLKQYQTFMQQYADNRQISNPDIAKIYFTNIKDQIALTDIINNVYESYTLYNLSTYESIPSAFKCIYTNCPYECNIKTYFCKHLLKVHDLKGSNTTSNLFNAYDILNMHIVKRCKSYTTNQLKKLYSYIINDIDVTLVRYNDIKMIARSFNFSELDIVKKLILDCLDKKELIYNMWTDLQNKVGKLIFDVAISIFASQKSNIDIQEYNSKTIIELYSNILIIKNDQIKTLINIKKYFKVVEKVYNIYENIKNDKFGRLINTHDKISLPWNAYNYLMLPVFYFDLYNTKCIELFVKWYFHNIFNKNISLNSEELLRITNKTIRFIRKNKQFNYFVPLKKLLTNQQNIKYYMITPTKLKYLTYFIETNHTLEQK